MLKNRDNKKPQSVLKTFVNEAGAFIYEDVILDRVKVTDDTVLIGMYINNPYTLNSALVANNLTTQYNISDVHVPIIVAFHTPSKALAKKLAKSPTFAKNKKIKLAMLATFSEKNVGSEGHRHKQVVADVEYGAFIVIDEEKTMHLESEENLDLEKARERKPVIKTAYDEIIPEQTPESVVATKTNKTDTNKKEHNGFGLKLPKLPSFSIKKEKHEVEDVQTKSNIYVPKEDNTLNDIADEIEPPVKKPERKVSRSASFRQEKKAPTHTVQVEEPETTFKEEPVNDIETIDENIPVINKTETSDNIEIDDPFGEYDIEAIDEDGNESYTNKQIPEEVSVQDEEFVNADHSSINEEIDDSEVPGDAIDSIDIDEEIEETPVNNKKNASVFSLFGKKKSQSNENNHENSESSVEYIEDDDDDDELEVEVPQIVTEKEENNQVDELEEEEEEKKAPKSENVTEPVDNDLDELKRLLDEI